MYRYKNQSVGRVKSQQQIEKIQLESIDRIKVLYQQITTLTSQIHDYTSQIDTHEASPIKISRPFNSSPTSHTYQLMALPIFNTKTPLNSKHKGNQKNMKNIQDNRNYKKQSEVHFTHYMKSTGNISLKVKKQIQDQIKQKAAEADKSHARIQQIKFLSNKKFKHVGTKFQDYKQTSARKQQAIAQVIHQKQRKQMQGVTFSPQLNESRNKIKEPFESRLKLNKIQKQFKQAKIIKESIKNETFRPKLNNSLAESKIKSIWKKQSHQSPRSSRSIHEDQIIKINGNQAISIFTEDQKLFKN